MSTLSTGSKKSTRGERKSNKKKSTKTSKSKTALAASASSIGEASLSWLSEEDRRRVAGLEALKQTAVENEDFDRAKEIKAEIEALINKSTDADADADSDADAQAYSELLAMARSAAIQRTPGQGELLGHSASVRMSTASGVSTGVRMSTASTDSKKSTRGEKKASTKKTCSRLASASTQSQVDVSGLRKKLGSS